MAAQGQVPTGKSKRSLPKMLAVRTRPASKLKKKHHRGMKASGMSVCTQRTPETQEAGEELKNGFWAWRQNESERTWKLLSHVQLFATVYIVHGILQPRILEWVAFPFSRGSSQPRDWTRVSCIAGRFFTAWASTEAPVWYYSALKEAELNISFRVFCL